MNSKFITYESKKSYPLCNFATRQNSQWPGFVEFANIQSSNDYYPFGSTMAGRGYSQGTYKFGFNGQESSDEVYGQGTLYDFKFREHDTRIGRFWSVDPLMKEYPWNSPYAFAENRVIDGVELEGLEVNLINAAKSLKDMYLAHCGSHIKTTNTIHIFGHGSTERGVKDDRGVTAVRYNETTKFDEFMDKESEVWKNKEESVKNGEQIIVVLHVCRQGEFAKKLSKANPGVIFIASDFKVIPNRSQGSATYPNAEAEAAGDQSVEGPWNVYLDGEKIGEQPGRIKPEYNEPPYGKAPTRLNTLKESPRKVKKK